MNQRYTWNSCCFLFVRWCLEKVSRESLSKMWIHKMYSQKWKSECQDETLRSLNFYEVSTSICRITKSVNFHTKYREAKILGSYCGQDFALLGAQSNTSAYYRDWTTPELCPFLVCGRYPFLGQCPRHLSVLEKICRGVTLSPQQSEVYFYLQVGGEIADLHGTWDILTVWTNVTIFDSSDKMW